MADEILRKPTGAHVKLGTFVLLIILVAIAFGGAGLLYGINAGKAITATKTATATASVTSSKTATASATATDVTVNWKTYTNTANSFSVKYPAEYQIKEKTVNNLEERGIVSEFVLYIGKSDTTLSPDNSIGIYVDSFKDNTNVKINEPDGMDVTSSSDTLVNGQKAKKYNGLNEASYVTTFNNRLYTIGTNSEVPADVQAKLDTILSTFKFTK